LPAAKRRHVVRQPRHGFNASTSSRAARRVRVLSSRAFARTISVSTHWAPLPEIRPHAVLLVPRKLQRRLLHVQGEIVRRLVDRQMVGLRTRASPRRTGSCPPSSTSKMSEIKGQRQEPPRNARTKNAGLDVMATFKVTRPPV